MTDAYDCYCINLAVNLIFFKINKICCYLLHVHMTLDNCHRQQKTTTTLFNLLLYNREIYILYYIILYYIILYYIILYYIILYYIILYYIILYYIILC